MDIKRISALAELERYGIKFEPMSDESVKFCCPVHGDKNPSAGLKISTNRWKCFTSGCDAKGDIITLLALSTEKSRHVIIADLSTRYDLETVKIINPERIEKMHKEIWNAGPLLQALYDRAVDDQMIRDARLGYENGRITIPIYYSHNAVNVRRYLPGAPGHEKMRNSRGYGKPRLYQRDDIFDLDKPVVICGGELKALVLKHKEPSVAAVAVTAGEGAWDASFTPLFKDREVYVCYDVDAAGNKAAVKVAALIAQVAKFVKIIKLPLDQKKFPTGDLNDYFAQGATANDFVKLMQGALEYNTSFEAEDDVEVETRKVSLAQTTRPRNAHCRLDFEAIASAADTTPYLVPKCVKVECMRDQANCASCPISMKNLDDDGLTTLEIAPHSEKILNLADERLDDVRLSSMLGIPACKAHRIQVTEYHSVTDVRLVPQLRLGDDSHDHVVQPAMVVNRDLKLNSPYLMSGRVYPHPKNQQATLVVDDVEEASDSLSRFELTEATEHTLSQFRPSEWSQEALESKLHDIYSDLSENVTQIYDRFDMHLAMDLTWHSVLFIPFYGKQVNGWVNGLIIGDSAQGKSETARCLLTHYDLGEWVECKNSTIPGLVGGLQQLGNRWFVSWGVIPTHDKGLVILEEVKGMPTENIGRMTDMRSRGVAEIPKIERQRTLARTRLLWISNPRKSRSLSSYAFGIESVRELIGALEDVRRFDFAYIASSGRNIDRTPRLKGVPKYTKEMCTKLVLYSWTRSMDQIKIEDPEHVMQRANELMSKFSDAIPLVDKGTTHHKLVRLATALAARTFSNENGILVVRKCHVDYIADWLTKTYSEADCGYDRFSEASNSVNTIGDPASVRKIIEDTAHPEDFIQGLLYSDEITQLDVQDFCAVDRDAAQRIISRLVRARAIRRKGRSSYVKTSDMIDILKNLVGNVKSNKKDYQGEFS